MVNPGPATGWIDLSPLKTMKQVQDRNGKPAWKCIAEECRRNERPRVGFYAIRHAYEEHSTAKALPPEFDRYWCSQCEYNMKRLWTIEVHRDTHSNKQALDPAESENPHLCPKCHCSFTKRHSQYCVPQLEDEEKPVPSARFRSWVGGEMKYEYKDKILYQILVEPVLKKQKQPSDEGEAAALAPSDQAVAESPAHYFSEPESTRTPSLHELEAQLVRARKHHPPNWTLIENIRREIKDLIGSSSKSLAKPSVGLTARQKVVYRRGYYSIY